MGGTGYGARQFGALRPPVELVTTVLHGGRIIDGSGAEPIDDGFCVIEDGSIVDVGAGTPGSLPVDAESFDLRGATLLPGLIDCHVHLGGFHGSDRTGGDTAYSVASDTLAVATGLRRLLAEGVTSVRDCGYAHHGIFALRDAQCRGTVRGSRMFLSGRALCATGGHGAAISVEVDGVDAVRRAARAEMKAGADWIKLMMTGGTLTPNELVSDVQLTVEEAAAAVGEAHRRGRRVSAHCSNLAGTLAALDAGVDSVEHGIELDEHAISRMTERGVWLSAGLVCTRAEAEAGPESGIPEHVRIKAAEIYRPQVDSFRRAHAAGVSIVAATDAGPFYFPLESASLIAELEVMTELGMSTLEAIGAATGQATKLLGVDDHLGTIRVGKLADLLVVQANPIERLRALADPIMVMQAGSVVVNTL